MYKLTNLFFITLLVITGCASDQSGTNSGTINPVAVDNESTDSVADRYCQDVDGQVKTVSSSGGEQSFCILPSGDVVDLEEFYKTNH